jgi:ceramide glucosyltransferase
MADLIFGGLAVLSLLLTLWQWLAARRFPLHRRGEPNVFKPAVTLLKPLKGCDPETEACLRSWFAQVYGGPVQILLGVARAEDPVCAVVRRLQQEFPGVDAELRVCGALAGANAKVSKLAELEGLAKHGIVVISDADVRVPPDFLAQAVGPLQAGEVGLVNCFYRLANPSTVAMRWEAVAINVDFWSQVLQSNSLKPMDFALGAVMVVRRAQLAEIGGFRGLVDCLADDYQLGHRLAGRGHRLALSPVVVDCWSAPMGWGEVWKHQVRWARTIRVCQPLPYFFSILSNATFWPVLWLAAQPGRAAGLAALGCGLVRLLTALDLARRLDGGRFWRSWFWMPWLKDLLQVGVWLSAFLGNRVEWRGQRLRLRRDGTVERLR